jgi:hypothetical protein
MPRTLILGALLLGALGCTDYGPNDEATGNMIVIATTLGTPDPDGYTIDVTGQTQQMMTATDTAVFINLNIGNYTVALGDVEGGCNVTDGASRDVYQTVGQKTVVYQIVCP